MLVYGARDAFADAMFDFARAYAQKVCPRLADDLRGATDWYKAHDGPLYIRVNAQAFLGAGLDEELRIVEEVRVALGLPALRSLPTTLLGAADADTTMPLRAIDADCWKLYVTCSTWATNRHSISATTTRAVVLPRRWLALHRAR